MAAKKQATKKTSASKDALKFPMGKKLLIELYRYVVQMRLYEDKLPLLYRQGKLFGGVYRAKGHESIAAGAALTLEPQDILAPTHRDAAMHMIRGQSMERMYCNYMGREFGPTRGRDGNVHHGEMDKNIIGMISHLGTNIPLAVGAALGKRMQGENAVALATIGDGGSSIGDFHEGLNFAAVQKAPLVLIIENNQYAYSTPNSMQYACEQLVDRAVGYGIKGMSGDGTNAVDVYQITKEAVEYARSGNGPVLIEFKTMRMSGHSEHDNYEYVPEALLEEWRQKDPVEITRNYMIKKKILTKSACEKIDAEVKVKVDEAAVWAYDQPFPQGESILDGVYHEGEL
jgi:TPP-dependent pyruvate/acetoin dehydrogenase alpha subunit